MKKKQSSKNKGKKPEKIAPANEKKGGEGARQRIIKAARKVFSLHSFRAASTRMIAQEAGVDHPLIHYHFGSKEKLFESVSLEMYDEFTQAHLSWLEGLERMPIRDGLSLYLDRLLDYTRENPEPLQIILLNMVHIGRLEEIPGYQYILKHMDRIRITLEDRINLRASRSDTEIFIHCFNNLLFVLMGAENCQAQVLKLDPEGEEYRQWVKNAFLLLFLPLLEKLIFPEGRKKSSKKKKTS